MRDEGTTVPDITAPIATPAAAAATDRGSYTSADISARSLADAATDGPITLAFFPGVYSRTCTQELCQLSDWTADLSSLPGTLYGASADTPWSQLAFIDEYDITYPLMSTFNNELGNEFDVKRTDGHLAGITGRAVFVLDTALTVRYAWETSESLVFPDLEAIESTIKMIIAEQ